MRDVQGGSIFLGPLIGTAIGKAPTNDKLGNFEIQDLMSKYNQSEQLASSVQKKKDDRGVIGKIG